MTLKQRWRVPVAWHEELIAELFAGGTLGLVLHQERDGVATVDAFFAGPPGPRPSERLRHRGAGTVFEQQQPARDWLLRYREAVQPATIGRRFLVDPREPGAGAPAAAGDRIVLRVPARRAFGTGSHATTQLVLEGMERLPLEGRRVLDVGTGTGVLAFAARALGAAAVVALDVDPVAGCHARENERWNGRRLALLVGTADCLRAAPAFDVLLVNELAERLRADVPRLARLLRPGGVALVSGLLAAHGDDELAPWRAAGLLVVERAVREEWLAVRLARRGPR